MPSASKSKMRLSTFKGNKMLQFGDPDDRYSFSFGAEKARKLLDAIKTHGADTVVAAIEKLVAEKDAAKAADAPVTEEIVGAEESGATAELPAVAETLL